MKFNKLTAIEWRWSGRKEAALKRKYQKQVDATPLFADEIRSEQLPIETVKAQREEAWNTKEANERVNRAAAWRKARKALFALPKSHRLVIRNMWNLHQWRTHEPHYLADLIHGYVVLGKRPTKLQITKYGEAFQPVDYCSVSFGSVRLPSPKKATKQGTVQRRVNHEENLSLFYEYWPSRAAS